MKVQIWHSFSSNNSASFYVVAHFDAPELATACADELRRYIADNDRELAEMSRRERRANQDLTMANLELSDRTGLDWPVQITQGYADDIEIEIETIDGELAIYHDYCLGFDETLKTYLEKRAVSVNAGRVNRFPTLSLIVHRPEESSHLESIRMLFAGLHATLDAPANALDPLVTFATPSAIGFASPISLEQIAALTALIDAAPELDVEVALDRAGDIERFRHIASAECSECGDRLDFIAAERSEAPADQLACLRCGGMFTLVVPAPDPN